MSEAAEAQNTLGHVPLILKHVQLAPEITFWLRELSQSTLELLDIYIYLCPILCPRKVYMCLDSNILRPILIRI